MPFYILHYLKSSHLDAIIALGFRLFKYDYDFMLSYLTNNWLCILTILIFVAAGVYYYRRQSQVVMEVKNLEKEEEKEKKQNEESEDEDEESEDEDDVTASEITASEQDDNISEYQVSETEKSSFIPKTVEGLPKETFT
jgi:hypothetical protein